MSEQPPHEPPLKVRQLSTVHDIGDTRVTHKQNASLVAAGYDTALLSSVPEDMTYATVPVRGIGKPRNRLERMTVHQLRMLRRALAEDAEVYHFHDPELIPVGLLLKARGRQVVYDVHEDVPKQIMNKFWIHPAAKLPFALAARGFEHLAGQFFDGIVTATPSIAEKFPAVKTVVVQNFPEASLAAVRNDTPFEARTNAFVYVGGLSQQQGLFEMLDAFTRLPDGANGVLAGRFKQREAEARAHPGWAHVRYPGSLDRDRVVAELRDSKVGLVLDHPITNYVDAYSTKMFEYMATGLPVICSNFPMWVDIVRDTGCGVAVDPFDTAAVAAALNRYLDDPDLAREHGENGRRAIAARLNWGVEFAKLDRLYKRLAVRRRGRTRPRATGRTGDRTGTRPDSTGGDA